MPSFFAFSLYRLRFSMLPPLFLKAILYEHASLSLTRTTSPTERFRRRPRQFSLTWRFWRNSCLQRSQNWSARYCALRQYCLAYRFLCHKHTGRLFMVSNMAGFINGLGWSISDEIAVIGRLLTIPVTSASNVTNSSWSSWELPIFMQ